jgi:A/G-specific adenine glycosylase
LPRSEEELRKIPGFGPYTIGAVLSIAFDKRVAIIDANVRRVVMRLLALPGPADTLQDKKIRKFLEQILPQQGNRIFNQALMELGALVCRSREPFCLNCPVKVWCKGYRQGRQELIPETRKKTIKEIKAVIAILGKGGRYFIQQRPPRGLLAGLWEFPGGKIKPGEDAVSALRRELKEELGADLVSARHFMDVTHCYTKFRVKLKVLTCRCSRHPVADPTHRWVTKKDFVRFPMPSGSARIVDRLCKI